MSNFGYDFWNNNNKWIKPFNKHDPFNDNQVTGLISLKPDHRYGALLIQTVNGKDAPQAPIYCTPKIKYPFSIQDGKRKYEFPQNVSRVVAYQKLDGTNVCQYAYMDHHAHVYVSYKTRLNPFISNGPYGNFYDMWREILDKYPEIHDNEYVRSTLYTLSYEMYGSRNKILVSYETKLDVALLFRIDCTGSVVPPDYKPWGECEIKLLGTVPRPKRTVLDGETKTGYERLRSAAEKANPHDGYTDEGYVFYIKHVVGLDTGSSMWTMYKCKPDCIEQVHWASSDISFNVVFATAMNAAEGGKITYESVRDMLLEEFQQNQIDVNDILIRRAIDTAIDELRFRKFVEKTYRKVCDGCVDKDIVMKKMSFYFPKSDMTHVYHVLNNNGLI